MFAILSSLIRVYTNCHSRLSDQVLQCVPFPAVWSGSTLFAILSGLIRFYTVCYSKRSDQGLHHFPFSVWSRSTLFAIHSSLIRIYTICDSSKQHYQGLQCLPLWAVWSESTLVKFSAVLSVSTLYAILRLIKVYSICHSQQSRSTLFGILSRLIRVYTICHYLQSDQGLHSLPFSAVWSGLY